MPEHFNAIGSDTASVPFSTLFTGIILANLFYWCTNQVIIQRALSAKSLKEGQKGVLFAGFLKLLGPFILIVPGIIAFKIFGQELTRSDMAYPALVKHVLPPYLLGFFAAVLVGAILSSFNSTLNSAATLFSFDLYKIIINKKATDKQVLLSGKYCEVFLALISMCIAPLIMYAPQGLFGYLQHVTGLYSVPIFTIIVMGLLAPRLSSVSARVGLISGVIFYLLFKFIFPLDMHYLHLLFVNLVFISSVMLILGRLYPRDEPWIQTQESYVNIQSWIWAWPSGLFIISSAIGCYIFFSPYHQLWSKPFWFVSLLFIAFSALLSLRLEKRRKEKEILQTI